MAHESFAQTVFAALIKLSAATGEATVADLSHALHLQTRVEHKRMLNALSDMTLSGKVGRVRQGVYAPSAEPPSNGPDLREVMWRVLRMRRRVVIADLIEMAGASRDYAKEWLQMLEKHEIVRRIPQAGNQPHVWQLLNDTVEMPVDSDKAAKHRELRKKKKAQAISLLNAAQDLITTARRAINEMEE